jgi:hypothetical protein
MVEQEGLRPCLSKYQAGFRKWWANLIENVSKRIQEVVGFVDRNCIKKNSGSGGHRRNKLYQEEFKKRSGVL